MDTREKTPLPDIDKKFNDVDRRIKDFQNLYKAEQDKTEQASYSKEKKQQKFNIAKHGSTGEGLSAIVGLGHNEIVLACIVQRDLKNLIKATELGASLQTTSISKEKALEDLAVFRLNFLRNSKESPARTNCKESPFLISLC